MKSPKYFESCLTTHDVTVSPYEWLINQDHIPFDMTYYWYSNNKLSSSFNGDESIVYENHIKIDKQKLRELKIKEIIENEQLYIKPFDFVSSPAYPTSSKGGFDRMVLVKLTRISKIMKILNKIESEK